MYYCIKCKELHDENVTTARVFTTGFHTLQDQKTAPLGICCQEEVQQAEQVQQTA